jgi:cell division protease FtsH
MKNRIVLCLLHFLTIYAFPQYLDILEHKHKHKLQNHRHRNRNHKKQIIHSNELGNFGFQQNNSTTPQNIFIPISKLSGLLGGNQTRRLSLLSSSSSSENNQFNLEKDMGKYNFSCVGGYQDVKTELYQILDFIQRPEEYQKYGVRIPKGILLEGPTGNGKTLIAKCLAGEAKMNFVSCSGSEFMEKYVGVGASRVRELFKFIQNNAPCILFIDEFDAIGRKRSQDAEATSNSERDQTLNQLLVYMDGFSGQDSKPILVVAATNRLDTLDSAAIRPGRFDKIIHVPNPDTETRKAILEIHSSKKPLNVSMDYMIRLTYGFNGAQIENILNEATLYAIRTKSLPVNVTHLENIREKMIIGRSSNNSPKQMSESALRRIAIHETGHLLMALQSSSYEKPWKITIESINPKQSLGYVIFDVDEVENEFMLREYLQDKIKVLLGGRVAEEVIYGHSVSSGAVEDLEKAFSIARAMIMDYGMGSKIIYPYMSETFKRQIDENIHVLILHLYSETKKYISSNQDLLNVFVETLIQKKTLVWDEIEEIYKSFS